MRKLWHVTLRLSQAEMRRAAMALCALCCLVTVGRAADGLNTGNVRADISVRFADENTTEVPDFQKHVVPLFGRLGCNGRACHGSFQGRGGFQLSLFGYDFKADHGALFNKDRMRVNLENADESMFIAKGLEAIDHEGGKRFDAGSWQHRVLKRWIESGGKNVEELHVLKELKVEPAEILFASSLEPVQLRVIAEWSNGEQEDVTTLCRFQTNNDQYAKISEAGIVSPNEAGDTHVVVAYDKKVVAIPVLRPVSENFGEKYPAINGRTKVDQLVIDKLKKLGVVPSDVADDATFLRRVYLDATGTLPTPQEVRDFLADTSPDKRAKKIDQLLDSPAYAAWWTTKLCDFTGNNSDQLNNVTPIQNQAAQDWYDWIHKRVSENAPYDQLVAGIVTAVSRQPGQSYTDYSTQLCEIYRGEPGKSFANWPSMPYYWARREYRDPEARAVNFAYAFMGVRIECAQCHKHPFDQWSKEEFDEFKKFFASVQFDQQGGRGNNQEYKALVEKLQVDKEKKGNQLRQEFAKLIKEGQVVPMPEVVVAKPRDPRREAREKAAAKNRKKGEPASPPPAEFVSLLGHEKVDFSKTEDPRVPLMDWLRRADNPYFAKAFVNRVWAHYFGKGIVNPPDDMSQANAPSNAPLLDYLAQGFIASGFDMKWLHREILNSDTYQRAWQPNETNRLDERNFARSFPRRLPAEIVYDALQQATASVEDNAKYLTEVNARAIALPAAGNRGNGNNRGASQFALRVFGRSTRDSNCDCDRSEDASLLQVVYLQNDSELHAMIDRNGSWLTNLKKEFAPGKPKPNPNANKADSVDQQIRRMEKRLAVLDKEKNKDEYEKLTARLKAAQDYREKSFKELPVNPEPEIDNSANDAKVEPLIVEAYLRTLGRLPQPSEMARSKQYVTAEADRINGLRGLMWALVNTKEFLLNH